MLEILPFSLGSLQPPKNHGTAGVVTNPPSPTRLGRLHQCGPVDVQGSRSSCNASWVWDLCKSSTEPMPDQISGEERWKEHAERSGRRTQRLGKLEA